MSKVLNSSKENRDPRRNLGKVGVDIGLNEKIVLLKFDQSGKSNLRLFKDQSLILCTATLGIVAKVINTGLLPLEADPEIPERDTKSRPPESDDHFDQRLDNYRLDRKEVQKANREILAAATKVFGIIFGNMSELSKERAAQAQVNVYAEGTRAYIGSEPLGEEEFYDDWEDVIEAMDPERLMQRIMLSHQGITAASKTETRFKTLEAFRALKMRKDESLQEFRKRFNDGLEAIEATGGTVPPEDEQSYMFLNAIQNVPKFRVYKEQRLVSFSATPFPDTLPKLYEELLAWRPEVSTLGGGKEASKPETAFVTKTKTVAASKKEQRTTKAVEGKQKKATEYKCYCCGKTGHIARTCPQRATSSEDEEEEPPKPQLTKKEQRKAKRDAANILVTRLNEGMSNLACEATSVTCLTVATSTEVSAEKSEDEDDEPPSGGGGACRYVLALKNPNSVSDRVVLFDSGATQSVFFNKSLLRNVEEGASISISGITSGSVVNTNLVGDFDGVPGVYYCPSIEHNVISQSAITPYCDISLVDNVYTVTIRSTGSELVFTLIDGLYMHTVPPRKRELVYSLSDSATPGVCFSRGVSDRAVSVNVTVAENARMFNKREAGAAERAYRLWENLGFPGADIFKEMLKSGAIKDCPVTVRDAQNAITIYGEVLASVRGKMKLSAVKNVLYDPKELNGTPESVVLHVDIMFVAKLAFLVSVAVPTGMSFVSSLGAGKGKKSADVLEPALLTVIHALRARNYVVTVIVCDGESAVAALRNRLASKGVLLNQVGSGTHAPVAEVKIKEIKERARGIIATLPFKISSHFMPALVMYCVSRINLVPHKATAGGVSPMEMFQGIKPDFVKTLGLKFGDYVEVVERDAVDRNSIFKSRTKAAIALRPTGNLSASWRFLSLDSGSEITRDAWKLLPMPDVIIKKLNLMAWRDKQGEIMVERDFALTEVEREDFIDESVDGPEELTPAVGPAYEVTDDRMEMIDELPPADVDSMEEPAPAEGVSDDFIVSDENFSELPEVSDTAGVSDGSGAGVSDAPMALPTAVAAEPAAHPYNLRRRGAAGGVGHTVASILTAALTSDDAEFSMHVINHLSVKKAMESHPEETKDAIMNEIEQLLEMQVFDPVEPDVKVSKPIRSFLFMKEKKTPEGVFERMKARWVGMGNGQNKDDYLTTDISSPTCSLPSLLMILARAAARRQECVVGDVPVAYLKAMIGDKKVHVIVDVKMAEMIVAVRPEWKRFVRKDGTMVVLLLRALYGCVESAKRWYMHASEELGKIGFVKNLHDECVFTRLNGEERSIILLYVDDFFMTSTTKAGVEIMVSDVQSIFPDIKLSRGKVLSYLGMRIELSDEAYAKVSMPAYTDEIISTAAVTGHARTPAASHLFDVRDDAVKLDSVKSEEFHSLVAKLLYLAKRTRPDILLPVSFLTTRVQAPDVDDYGKLMRVLKYLNSSVGLGIALHGDADTVLRCYVDASYGVHSDAKSHTGMLVTLGGGPVMVKSTKQKIVTKSSTEAELVALSDSASVVIWARDFLIGIGEKVGPAVVYQDNQSTMALIERGSGASDRSKHIKIRYFWVKDRVASGELQVEYMATEDMLADVLTKPLQGEQFFKLRGAMLNWKCS